MRKLLVFCLALSVGCVSVPGRGVVIGANPQPEPFQQNVDVVVTNNCAPFLQVFSGDSVPMLTLGYSRTYTVRLIRPLFSGRGNGVYLPLSVKAYARDKGRGYIGSASGRNHVNLYVDTYNAGRTEDWTVDRLDSPNGAECPKP